MSELFTHDILPLIPLYSLSLAFLDISSSNSSCSIRSSRVGEFCFVKGELELTLLVKSPWLFCWLRVEVEPLLLQKVLMPFFILAPKEFLRRKKGMSFMNVWLVPVRRK
ncbi:hypothetical protein V8G54_005240 [Vigna mungo]|uniref:Uncharacterized protein n=1 Tax=Vigna mungo TaxID=3915 RepID=A0AAQ3PD33_VIGMU